MRELPGTNTKALVFFLAMFTSDNAEAHAANVLIHYRMVNIVVMIG